MGLDGHDSRISYDKRLQYDQQEVTRRDLYSWKLKKSGFRTQILMDVNEYIIFVSDVSPCSKGNDGTMFIESRIDNKMTNCDCLLLDGLYLQYIGDLVELNKKENGDIKYHNFCCPIRKQRNIEFSVEETKYNKKHGSFRSAIETKFAQISNIFKRFSHKKITRVSDGKIFGLQLKFCCLLLNIKFIFFYKLTIVK